MIMYDTGLVYFLVLLRVMVASVLDVAEGPASYPLQSRSIAYKLNLLLVIAMSSNAACTSIV